MCVCEYNKYNSQNVNSLIFENYQKTVYSDSIQLWPNHNVKYLSISGAYTREQGPKARRPNRGHHLGPLRNWVFPLPCP